MGSGTSNAIALPNEFEGFTDLKKNDLKTQYEALLTDGKTAEEAIRTLEAQVHAISSTSANFVHIELTQLVDAMESAIERGKTPLIVDGSDRANTFFSYRTCTLLDGKKMAMDKSMRSIPIREILDEARTRLVGSIKCGHPFVIAMSQCVPDYAKTFNDDALPETDKVPGELFFPLEVFHRAGKGLLKDDIMEKLFRKADRQDSSGQVFCRDPDKFCVVLTTSFKAKDFQKYLFGKDFGLPKPESLYEFIIVKEDEACASDAGIE